MTVMRVADNKQSYENIVRDAARKYRERGWKPIPVPSNKKNPIDPEWQKKDYPDSKFDRWGNIGVQFGECSAGLCDVDLDCAEVLKLADDYLFETNAEFGRKSKPLSHRLYYSDLHKTVDKAALQFRDPVRQSEQPDTAMLVELRIGGCGKGAQSMFPPSNHPGSGERVRWDSEGEPKRVKGLYLKDRVADLAAAALLLRYYPKKGQRDEAAMAFGGMLARAGWKAHVIERFFGPIVRAAGDEEAEERIKAAVASIEHLKTGRETTGYPTVAEIWGEDVARKVSDWLGLKGGGGKASKPSSEELEMICVADVEKKKVDWLWDLVLARGKVTILVGDPGGGKSQIAVYAAGRISRGDEWIDGDRAQRGHVIVLAAEDAIDDTIRPRLEATGADIDHVHVVGMVTDQDGNRRLFNLRTDLNKLRRKIDALRSDGRNVELVVIDPISAYLGDLDAHMLNKISAVMNEIADFARTSNLAVMAIHHPPKQAPKNAIHVGAGSLGFGAGPRLVFLVTNDPDNPERKLMLAVKNTNGPLRAGRGYRIAGCAIEYRFKTSRIEWDDEVVTVSANEALRAQNCGEPSKVQEAADFLSDILEGGPMLNGEVERLATSRDIGQSALRRAKKKLNIVSEKSGFGDGWLWSLPQQD
jgi:hypothetical protein